MKKNKSIKVLLILICIIALVAVAVCVYIKFFRKIKTTEFDDKINIYGLNKMYNNGSNNPNENVTKLEAIKLVIASTKNTIDLSTLILGSSTGDDAKVLEYAYKNGITSEQEVNLSNCNKKAKIIDLVKYISKAKYYILKQDYKKTENVLLKDYKKYSDDDKEYILDLLANEVIENNKYKLNGYSYLKKSICNKLIVKYITNFNLLSKNGNIVTDQAKMPSNFNEYPYILEDVDKEVYEQAYDVDSQENFLKPSEFYSYRKEYYDSTINTAEDYYNTILNVSYQTINYEDMYNKLKNLVIRRCE